MLIQIGWRKGDDMEINQFTGVKFTEIELDEDESPEAIMRFCVEGGAFTAVGNNVIYHIMFGDNQIEDLTSEQIIGLKRMAVSA